MQSERELREQSELAQKKRVRAKLFDARTCHKSGII